MIKKNRMRQQFKAIKMELREHKSSFAVFVVLRALVIMMMVLQLYNRNYENVFLCLLTLLLFLLPSFVQVNFRIELPSALEIIILLFIFSAEILGEISEYYVKIPIWDTILHTMNGFLAAAIGFSLVDILNREVKLKFKLSPLFMSIVAFCFSMTIGVVWEFFEYGMDNLLGYDMQKDAIITSIQSVLLNPEGHSIVYTIDNIKDVTINGQNIGINGYLDIGLHDTMGDLLVNFVGAVIFSTIGYIYVKHRGEGSVAKRFIPQLKKKDADYLNIVQESELREGEDQESGIVSEGISSEDTLN